MRRTALGGIALGSGLLWWLASSEPATSKLDGKLDGKVEGRTASELRDTLRDPRRGGFRLGTIRQAPREDGLVQITGTVRDRQSQDAVGEVEVVFRGPAGDESTIAGADGSYRIELHPGAYRAFVRDDSVLSVGAAIEERLPGFPDLDAIGAPDEATMPLVVAPHDLEQIDLFVMLGGTVYGRVFDGTGRPVARAVVRGFVPNTRERPALGSDLAETDAEGRYELRLPAGSYHLDADHTRFAGITGEPTVDVAAGARTEVDLTLATGCVIAGRVVGADGGAAGDGAIEIRTGDLFAPTGKILPNGTFRWTTTEEHEVELRAWPWKSPHSESMKFGCREGARFDNVVFRLPSRGPDISGVLVDAGGNPVPLAFIDLEPLDQGGIAQQERTGADGAWDVFAMPAGRYRLTGYAPGRGVISEIVESPRTNLRLVLRGTSRIEGKAVGLAKSSFELALDDCRVGGEQIKITEAPRLVSVRDGTFVIPDVPVCDVLVHIRSPSASWSQRLVIEPDRTSLTLDFANPPIDGADDFDPELIEELDETPDVY